ncbi:LOW QUALITY PROTEIN: copper transporter 1-like [Salvia miltiorrhiza]|uniref:LOW QUALITY PROTEIN: copper transporter 1-like n=1 Tax=Salvia miltiorrhiza TaxID=226208 RepID=UPI0025ACB23B|nr:LOW QUALITY PROTEIN: copper transporter 1-like [Salvia miltiorrhiza]
MNNGGGHMEGMAPPAPATQRRRMMMHMTFFWGKDTEILFDGWPGRDHLGMYLLALAVIFSVAVAVEWFSHCSVLKEKRPAAGLLQTLMYSLRIGLAYLVMLAIMSFNGGVFVVAVAGHAVGFFFFGSRAFRKQTADSDLPPVNCC